MTADNIKTPVLEYSVDYDYVHKVTFSSVFIFVFMPKRFRRFTIEVEPNLTFFLGSCGQGVKTINKAKTILKTLENSARALTAFK